MGTYDGNVPESGEAQRVKEGLIRLCCSWVLKYVFCSWIASHWRTREEFEVAWAISTLCFVFLDVENLNLLQILELKASNKALVSILSSIFFQETNEWCTARDAHPSHKLRSIPQLPRTSSRHPLRRRRRKCSLNLENHLPSIWINSLKLSTFYISWPRLCSNSGSPTFDIWGVLSTLWLDKGRECRVWLALKYRRRTKGRVKM